MVRIGTRHWGYRMEFLIQALLLARQCCSGNLKSVLSKSLAVALPPFLAKHFVTTLDSKSAVPSPTTIYRHRLTLHVGYMLFLRTVHRAAFAEADFVRYYTVDASPVGGREWVNTASTIIPKSKLVAAWASFMVLHDLGAEDPAGWSDEQLVQDRGQWEDGDTV